MDKEEFREKFEHAADMMNGSRNYRVVLVTNDPSVGGRCRLPIKHVDSGFDWERGDILLEVEDKIYSKEVSDFQVISKFIYSLDNSIYRSIRDSIDDDECRRVLLEYSKYSVK